MSSKANISSFKPSLFSNQTTYFLPTPVTSPDLHRTSISKSKTWKYYNEKTLSSNSPYSRNEEISPYDQDSDIEPLTVPRHKPRKSLSFHRRITGTQIHIMILYAVILVLFTGVTFLLTLVNSRCPEAKLFVLGRKGRVQRVEGGWGGAVPGFEGRNGTESFVG